MKAKAQKEAARTEARPSDGTELAHAINPIVCRLDTVSSMLTGAENFCELFATVDPQHINSTADALQELLQMIVLEIDRMHSALAAVMSPAQMDSEESREYLRKLRVWESGNEEE